MKSKVESTILIERYRFTRRLLSMRIDVNDFKDVPRKNVFDKMTDHAVRTKYFELLGKKAYISMKLWRIEQRTHYVTLNGFTTIRTIIPRNGLVGIGFDPIFDISASFTIGSVEVGEYLSYENANPESEVVGNPPSIICGICKNMPGVEYLISDFTLDL